MFKAIGNFIYRTPWWALMLFGISVLLLLGIFVTPFHVLNLQHKGVDSAQKQAIQREIDSNFGQSLLGVAEEVVKGIHDSTEDPARRAEMERALKEILRARSELENARVDIRSASGDAVKEARDVAREIAIGAAENVYEVAVEARELALGVHGRCHVVFMTAFDQYGLTAFETGAIDYVLKAYSDERLAATVARLRERLSLPAQAPLQDLAALVANLAARLAPSGERLKWIKASIGANLRLIPVDEVLFFQSDEKYPPGGHQGGRRPDQGPDQGTGRRAGPGEVLANPPRGDRQCDGHRQRQPRCPRASHGEGYRSQGKARRQPVVLAPLQADVKVSAS